MEQDRMTNRLSMALAALAMATSIAATAVALALGACVASACEPAAPAVGVEQAVTPFVIEVGEAPETPEAPAPKAAPARRYWTPKAPKPPRSVADTPDVPPAPAVAPLPPMPEDVSARGWFGFAFTCEECTIKAREGDQPPVWSFSTHPHVYRVEPDAPAGRAGILPGDVLIAIDGLALTSPEGGKRFGAVEPGQKVRWTVQRGAAKHTLAVVAAERPERRGETRIIRLSEELKKLQGLEDTDVLRRELERMIGELARVQVERQVVADAYARTAREQARTAREVRDARMVRQPLRYAGSVAGSSVEVRSFSPVNVTVSQDGDEIVITTGGTTVRVKNLEKAEKDVERAEKKR